MRTRFAIHDTWLLNVLDDVKEEMRELFGDKLKQVILFGSYARNEYDPDADIDIMILVDETDEELRKYRQIIADIMGELYFKYDKLISLTEESYSHYNRYVEVLPFFKNVHFEGIEVLNEDIF